MQFWQEFNLRGINLIFFATGQQVETDALQNILSLQEKYLAE